MAKSVAERQRECRVNRKAKQLVDQAKVAPAREVAERVYRFLVEFPEQAEKVDRSMRKLAQETRDRHKRPD